MALHAGLRTLAIPHEGSPFGEITVSIGLTADVPEPGSRYEDALGLADSMLNQAKQRGRNRTETAALPAPVALSA